jgi:nucleoid-associated protein EbfC
MSMFDMMKKLQEAQQKMGESKARLETITVEGKSPEGLIKVTANGNRVIKGITFASDSILQDKDQLEDYMIIAVNDALAQAEKVNEAEMKNAASGMMPGLGSMFGG